MSLRELMAKADLTLSRDDVLSRHHLDELDLRCERAARLVDSGDAMAGVALWQKIVDTLHEHRMESREYAEMFYGKVPLMAEARIFLARQMQRDIVAQQQQFSMALQWLIRVLHFAEGGAGKDGYITSGYEKVIGDRTKKNVRVERLEYMSHGGEIRSIVVLVADAMSGLAGCLIDRAALRQLPEGRELRVLYVCWSSSYCLLNSEWLRERMSSARESTFVHYWRCRQRAIVLFARLSALMGNYREALEIVENMDEGDCHDDDGPSSHSAFGTETRIGPLDLLMWRCCTDPDNMGDVETKLFQMQRRHTRRSRFAAADVVNRAIAEVRFRHMSFEGGEASGIPEPIAMLVRQFHNTTVKHEFIVWFQERMGRIVEVITSLRSALASPSATTLDALVRKLRPAVFGADILLPDGEPIRLLRSLEKLLALDDSLATYSYHMQCYHALHLLRMKKDLEMAEREVVQALSTCPMDSDAYIELVLVQAKIAVERGRDAYDEFVTVLRQLQRLHSRIVQLGLRDTFDSLFFGMHMRPGAKPVVKLLGEQMVRNVINSSSPKSAVVSAADKTMRHACSHLSAQLSYWLDAKHSCDERKFAEAKERYIGTRNVESEVIEIDDSDNDDDPENDGDDDDDSAPIRTPGRKRRHTMQTVLCSAPSAKRRK